MLTDKENRRIDYNQETEETISKTLKSSYSRIFSKTDSYTNNRLFSLESNQKFKRAPKNINTSEKQ